MEEIADVMNKVVILDVDSRPALESAIYEILIELAGKQPIPISLFQTCKKLHKRLPFNHNDLN